MSGRYEQVARAAHKAAVEAQTRASDARRRRDAAAARAAELRRNRLHPVHRPDEAAIRLAAAQRTAEAAHRLALIGLDHAALAHEANAHAHDRAALLLDSAGDASRAAHHRLEAARARAAADEDRHTIQLRSG